MSAPRRQNIAPKAREIIQRIYARHAAGCCWHVVLDDDNWDSIEFCKQWARDAAPTERRHRYAPRRSRAAPRPRLQPRKKLPLLRARQAQRTGKNQRRISEATHSRARRQVEVLQRWPNATRVRAHPYMMTTMTTQKIEIAMSARRQRAKMKTQRRLQQRRAQRRKSTKREELGATRKTARRNENQADGAVQRQRETALERRRTSLRCASCHEARDVKHASS